MDDMVRNRRSVGNPRPNLRADWRTPPRADRGLAERVCAALRGHRRRARRQTRPPQIALRCAVGEMSGPVREDRKETI